MRARWLWMWSRVLQYDHTETQLPSRSYHGDRGFYKYGVIYRIRLMLWEGSGLVRAFAGPLVASESLGKVSVQFSDQQQWRRRCMFAGEKWICCSKLDIYRAAHILCLSSSLYMFSDIDCIFWRWLSGCYAWPRLISKSKCIGYNFCHVFPFVPQTLM